MSNKNDQETIEAIEMDFLRRYDQLQIYSMPDYKKTDRKDTHKSREDRNQTIALVCPRIEDEKRLMPKEDGVHKGEEAEDNLKYYGAISWTCSEG